MTKQRGVHIPAFDNADRGGDAEPADQFQSDRDPAQEISAARSSDEPSAPVAQARYRIELPPSLTAYDPALSAVSIAPVVQLNEAELPPMSLRAADGVHMSRTGALRVWRRVREEILQMISG